jgi:hypothetical protein
MMSAMTSPDAPGPAGPQPLVGVDELIGVYDADGGLLGELRYLAGRGLGTHHCALCDLTHRRLRQRPEWDALVERLGVAFTLRHRNEQADAVRAATAGQLPCVVARRGATFTVLLGPDDLASCGRDLDQLERQLRGATRTPG